MAFSVFQRFFKKLESHPRKMVAVEDISPAKDDLFRVEWNLGSMCNFDCSYCSPNIHSKKGTHLSLEVVKRTAEKIAAHARKDGKKIRVSLTGGEPYLHPEFLELLQILKSSGIDRISITSNGSIPAKKYIESLNYINYLIISVHFEFIQLKKLLEKVIEIKSHLGKNQNLHMHVMVLPGKVQEALAFAKELEAAGVEYVLRRIRPQFSEDGVYLRPHNSGQLGGHRANWDRIKSENLKYYSEDELNLMGAMS